MDDKIRIDYLKNRPDLKVCQHKDMYHFNTDTCLLGEFIKVKPNETLLDVGTNNGALLVYAINKGAIATGIEVLSEAINVAKLTLEVNHFNATLINADFNNYLSENKFDVIISNPPYFKSEESEKNKSQIKSLARHESSLTLNSLFKNMANNLKATGRIYLVHRPDRLDEIIKELNNNDLYLNNYAFAKDTKDNKIKSVLIEASFNKTLINQLEDIYF